MVGGFGYFGVCLLDLAASGRWVSDRRLLLSSDVLYGFPCISGQSPRGLKGGGFRSPTFSPCLWLSSLLSMSCAADAEVVSVCYLNAHRQLMVLRLDLDLVHEAAAARRWVERFHEALVRPSPLFSVWFRIDLPWEGELHEAALAARIALWDSAVTDLAGSACLRLSQFTLDVLLDVASLPGQASPMPLIELLLGPPSTMTRPVSPPVLPPSSSSAPGPTSSIPGLAALQCELDFSCATFNDAAANLHHAKANVAAAMEARHTALS